MDKAKATYHICCLVVSIAIISVVASIGISSCVVIARVAIVAVIAAGVTMTTRFVSTTRQIY